MNFLHKQQENQMKLVYRQGEIGLVRVNKVPKKYRSEVVNSAVLGIGETGNTHTLTTKDNKVKWLYDAVDDINEINQNGAKEATRPVFIEIDEPGVVEHSDRQGHQQLPVPAGLYQVKIKQEQFPFEERRRYVAD